MELLKNQYELVTGSRAVMLDFVEQDAALQLIIPLTAFNGSNLRYLLVHTANVYKHWIGNFALGLGLPYADELTIENIDAIRSLYADADKLMADFLNKFDDTPEQPITSQLNGRGFTFTPLQLFTHVITHEFHHKGQLMTMCRLLGHTPPDTDIIRT